MAHNRKRRRQSAYSSEGYLPQTRSYQTRIAVYEGIDRSVGDAALSAYAALYAKVQHKLFADVAAGESAVSKKSEYIEKHGIPARMFNAVRITLDGKVSAVRESQLVQLDSRRRRVSRAEKQVLEAEQGCQWRQVHGKRRRLSNLKFRLSGLEADLAAGRVRLCFGSKKLWRKQYDLKANGYASREAWLEEWRDVRSNEFFVLGSRDETAGCQLCVASVNDDGTLTLRLRMPDGLAGLHGKYLVVPNVRFASGHDVVLAALGSNTEYAVYRREHGEKEARATRFGQAISYRFKRDSKGWRVFATTELPEVEVTTDRRRGAIGVDLNADHLAVVGNRCEWQLRESVAGAAGDLRQAPPSGGGVDWRRGGGCGGVRPTSVQAHRHRKAGLSAEESGAGRRVPAVQPDAVQLQLRQGQGVFHLPGLPGRS